MADVTPPPHPSSIPCPVVEHSPYTALLVVDPLGGDIVLQQPPDALPNPEGVVAHILNVLRITNTMLKPKEVVRSITVCLDVIEYVICTSSKTGHLHIYQRPSQRQGDPSVASSTDQHNRQVVPNTSSPSSTRQSHPMGTEANTDAQVRPTAAQQQRQAQPPQGSNS
eukprot:GHVN01007166.1.p1 GENE.GHVN01007166.1~~GHVN01007166.1.p1  ORF type:complete len:185 (+),score=38.14 GHVN01007166.1:55-555(+)